jgi:hypothetical protein
MALPFEHPKLAVTTVLSDGGLAERLDRALERIASPKVIEALPAEQKAEPEVREPLVSAAEMRAPFAQLERRRC